MTNNLLKQNLPIDYVIPFVDCKRRQAGIKLRGKRTIFRT